MHRNSIGMTRFVSQVQINQSGYEKCMGVGMGGERSSPPNWESSVPSNPERNKSVFVSGVGLGKLDPAHGRPPTAGPGSEAATVHMRPEVYGIYLVCETEVGASVLAYLGLDKGRMGGGDEFHELVAGLWPIEEYATDCAGHDSCFVRSHAARSHA